MVSSIRVGGAAGRRTPSLAPDPHPPAPDDPGDVRLMFVVPDCPEYLISHLVRERLSPISDVPAVPPTAAPIVYGNEIVLTPETRRMSHVSVCESLVRKLLLDPVDRLADIAPEIEARGMIVYVAHDSISGSFSTPCSFFSSSSSSSVAADVSESSGFTSVGSSSGSSSPSTGSSRSA